MFEFIFNNTTWNLVMKKKLLNIEASHLWYPTYFGLLAIWAAIFYQKLFLWVIFKNLHKSCHFESKLYLVRFNKGIVFLNFRALSLLLVNGPQVLYWADFNAFQGWIYPLLIWNCLLFHSFYIFKRIYHVTDEF